MLYHVSCQQITLRTIQATHLYFTFSSLPESIATLNPFPAVYEFILVFHSAANKYICFIFLIPSPSATNIFVKTINAPAHAHNSNHHFQCLEYFQQFEIYCILRLFSTFTSILSEYYLYFQFLVILDTLDLHVPFIFSTWFQIFENSFKYL